MADDDRLQDGFYHGSTKTAELILLASAVVCLKGVPESENLFIKFNAGCHDSYICAMDSVTHCFFLISTAISWHALIFLLSILHACQFESFCLWRSFLKFLLAEWRFLKLFFFSFALFQKSLYYIYTHIVCVCVFSKFLQKTFFHRNLNSFLLEKVPNNFFSCNQQPHLKKLKIEN